jgi:hypothetical protein
MLLGIASLIGCTSTENSEQANGTPAEFNSKIQKGDTLTSSELAEFARKTNFTGEQLQAAAKKIGYKCTFSAQVGSRLRKKECSTQQQRDVRAEAARAFLDNGDKGINSLVLPGQLQ